MVHCVDDCHQVLNNSLTVQFCQFAVLRMFPNLCSAYCSVILHECPVCLFDIFVILLMGLWCFVSNVMIVVLYRILLI